MIPVFKITGDLLPSETEMIVARTLEELTDVLSYIGVDPREDEVDGFFHIEVVMMDESEVAALTPLDEEY